MKRYIILLCAVWAMCACARKATNKPADCIGTQYAHYFAMAEHDTTVNGTTWQYKELRIYNPWEEGQPVLQRYYLFREAETPVPADGVRLQVPLTRVATGSCTHIGYIDYLGATDAICGVTDKYLVYTPLRDEVPNLGDCMVPDVERFLSVQPQVVFMSAYSTNDAATTRLQKAGLTVVPVMEWLENDPLGRAEWMRFFGAFFCLEEHADSLFARTANEYNQLKTTIEQSGLAYSKSVLSGGSFRGTWYVPSGSTYMGRLFADAGARYAYAEDQTNGSVPLSIEQVLASFKDADVWVGAPAMTLHELEEMDSKHTWFKAFQDSTVYTFKARTTPTGGNDFWEAGVCEPDRILSDLISVLYPSVVGQSTPKYMIQLR
ncbi:MAG: ABC transporter substrate-binding protein [Paludibacteraceae bacterium]|nr:ABC transporter substrate-binding protein [Paludibacteraceae bacterium]